MEQLYIARGQGATSKHISEGQQFVTDAAPKTQGSIDADEVAKFEGMAGEYWDPQGKYAPLHAMNPCRLDYIADQIAAEFDRDLRSAHPFDGLRIADIGCGGGLLTEPLARLGASAIGVDASQNSISVARAHADAAGLSIDYRAKTAEALLSEGIDVDAVLAMEILEHVADPADFLATCYGLLRPGGLLICSTLNRTGKSFAAAIVGAEWLLNWLPRGTHDWRKFVMPNELSAMLNATGFEALDRKGMVPDFLSGSWRLSERDLSVNYIMTAAKPE